MLNNTTATTTRRLVLTANRVPFVVLTTIVGTRPGTGRYPCKADWVGYKLNKVNGFGILLYLI